MKKPTEIDLKTLKEIDKILSGHYHLSQDTSNKGSRVYTKVYELNPHGKVRLFFDERSSIGTIKFRGNHTYPILCGISAFILVQVFSLILSTYHLI